jgi:hypothetical protein
MTANENYLLNLVPVILRARGFRLYSNGRRIVDLWQNGGSAVLGHTPPNVLREIKNTASRGLYAPMPHFLRGRYLKALSKLLPGYHFNLYMSAPAALEQLFNKGSAVLWRPYVNPKEPFALPDEKKTSIIIPILPGVQSWRSDLPQGLCVAALQAGALSLLPEDDILPPVLLAAAARGIYDLLAAPDRGTLRIPRINKALQNSPWRRKGIYLYLEKTPRLEEWNAHFSRFLAGGFLIPPVPSQPLILPNILSDGEEAALAALLGDNC